MNENTILSKTTRGREEIATRSAGLNHRERSLLVMADGKRCARELLAMTGASELAALDSLVVSGMLEPVAEAAPPVARAAAAAPVVPELEKAVAAVAGEHTPFRRTYAFLAAQIPEFFSLTAFTLTLKLEKAATLADLEPLKDKLVEAVEKKRGRGAANAYRERLLALARDAEA